MKGYFIVLGSRKFGVGRMKRRRNNLFHHQYKETTGSRTTHFI
jgi:hypothetical protein